MGDFYPSVGFYFQVWFSLPGMTDMDARFTEVSGLSSAVEVEPLVEGGVNNHAYQLPTGVRSTNLVLKRGWTTNTALTTWVDDAMQNFDFSPATVSVFLLNDQGEPLGNWSCIGAIPVKWTLSPFSSTDGKAVIEEVELSYQNFVSL